MASAVNNAFIVRHSTCVFLISNFKKEHYRVVNLFCLCVLYTYLIMINNRLKHVAET